MQSVNTSVRTLFTKHKYNTHKHNTKANPTYSTTGLEVQVHQVTEQLRNFKEEHEVQIVKHLIAKHSPNLKYAYFLFPYFTNAF